MVELAYATHALYSYNKARQVKEQQDSYCAKALAGEWKGLSSFPEDLQWEALVDVLRGKVKVHNHCYEAVDLDNMVRVSHFQVYFSPQAQSLTSLICS